MQGFLDESGLFIFLFICYLSGGKKISGKNRQ